MKYLKYFESLDTDEILDVFQDFIDEFSAIEWDVSAMNIPYYKIGHGSDNSVIQIAYWTLNEKIRNLASNKINQYLKSTILPRFKSMGIKYNFSFSKYTNFKDFVQKKDGAYTIRYEYGYGSNIIIPNITK